MSTDIEILDQRPLVDSSVVEAVTRSEIDQLIRTARQYPRSIQAASDTMISLACFDEDAALDCIYTLTRREKNGENKAIVGPSIRLAEVAASSWGNCRVAARTTIVDRSEKFVEAEGFFLDAQTNVAQCARIRRRISTSSGRVFGDDMIIVTANAAQSIARRNAILAGIPKMVWRPAFNRALQVVKGTADTLVQRRGAAIAAFKTLGLDDRQVFAVLGIKGVEDIDLERIVHLRGLYSAISNGDATIDELLRAAEPEPAAKVRVTAATATHAAPAVFDTDGLPSVDAAAPAPAPAPKTAPAAPKEKTRVRVATGRSEVA